MQDLLTLLNSFISVKPVCRGLVLAAPLWLLACSKAPDAPVAAPAGSATTAASATAASATASSPGVIAWHKPEGASVEALFAKAKAENKPVFLYWGAVWCPPCNQIKATVFNRPDFIAKTQSLIPVYLDGDTPGAQKLGAHFKVRGYPTTILFKPDGTEITRLPGEVDAAQYIQLLSLGLLATQPIKETLAHALAAGSGSTVAPALTADAWQMLAFYAWDTDEAQLVPPKELAATVLQLAQKCPPQFADSASRLWMRAAALSAQNTSPGLDALAKFPNEVRTTVQGIVHGVLQNPARARAHADVLAYYAKDIVGTITQAGSPERMQLLRDWNTALDRLVIDDTLSKGDQLGAVQAQVDLARLDSAQPDAALVEKVRAVVGRMDSIINDKYERQSVIPNATHLLSDVGLLSESDTLLLAELNKAVSPYYHMLVLAANAKKRGDMVASLDWAEKAYVAAVGPATRTQWGAGLVAKLVDLSPKDSARIAKAASQVIGELDPAPETFYERNRRSLEKMGKLLGTWSKKNKQAGAYNKLSTQMAAVCAKLPAQDSVRQACEGVLPAL
jgi:thioredoxin-like negative regulator of GroEL